MRLPRAIRVAVMFAGVVVAASGSGRWGRAHAAGGPISEDFVGQVATPVPAAIDRTVVRSRYITINFDNLSDPRSSPKLLREPSVPLELFPDVFVSAVFDRFDRNSTGVTWVGHVDGVSPSSVTLVYDAGLLSGSVSMPSGTFQIRPASSEVRRANPRPGRELHVVTQVTQDAFMREAEPIEVPLSAAAIASAAEAPHADTADTIDLLVIYTANTVTYAGGTTNAALNLINLGVSETNTSYANSGVQQRIRLVGTAQTSYVETGAFSTDLNDLRGGLGALSNVATLRDAVHADLVMLLIRPQAPDACGIAFIMTTISTAFAPNAFNVVDASCVSPNYTFAHEMGHNMGIRHDWYVDGGVTPLSYAHGYVNVGQRFRTIMAYADLCTVQGLSCTRLLSWANSDIAFNPNCTGRGPNCGLPPMWVYLGTPMGIPGGTRTNCAAGSITNTDCDADDHRALNQTASAVANFRQALAAAARR